MRNKTGSTRGFTLMELLMVITVLSIAGVGVVPIFLANTAHYRLKDSATRITDMIRFCQSMAVFQGCVFRLNIERERNACWVSFEKEPVNEPGQFVEYKASGYSLYRLQEGVVFAGLEIDRQRLEEEPLQEEYIEFRKDGTATRAALALGNEKGEYFTILVSPLTGSVRVTEEDLLAEETESEELRMENEEFQKEEEGRV